MKLDADKNLNIEYNILNLPRQITGPITQLYWYDAEGTKLAFFDTKDMHAYAGNIEFQNFKVSRIDTEMGYVLRTDTIINGVTKNKYSYFYTIRDNLGSVRMVIDEYGNEVQRTEYTPFGLPISFVNNSANNYLYNGKETQAGTGFVDYGARMYRSDLGRWMVPDKLSEIYHSLSPYNYVANNPLKFRDFGGNFIIDAETAKKYPALAYMVNTVLPNLANNPAVISALSKIAALGKRDRNYIANMFKAGSGPTLINSFIEAGYDQSDLAKPDRAEAGILGLQDFNNKQIVLSRPLLLNSLKEASDKVMNYGNRGEFSI